MIEKWEFEYRNENKIYEKYLHEKKQEFFNVLPLNPRDTLCGGRTSPFCLSYEAKEEEKI